MIHNIYNIVCDSQYVQYIVSDSQYIQYIVSDSQYMQYIVSDSHILSITIITQISKPADRILH